MNTAESNPPASSVSLPVTGMSCAACARAIEVTLKETPGVEAAAVNFATGRAAVTFDPAAVGLDGLVQAVRDAGYDVIDVRGEAAERRGRPATVRPRPGGSTTSSSARTRPRS